MESQPIHKDENPLNNIKRLKQPTPTSMLREWKAEWLETKNHAGFVLGMVLVDENPQIVRVFYNGGRRRMVGNEEKIVLEGVDIPTTELLSMNIRVGDLVRADWHFDRLAKIASYEDLQNQGVYIPPIVFNGQEVLGALC